MYLTLGRYFFGQENLTVDISSIIQQADRFSTSAY